MIALVPAWVASMLVGAPEIAQITPSPLPVGGTAELIGSGFVSPTLKIGEVVQRVTVLEATSLRFIVADATPLGAQILTLITPDGEATLAVEVVPPAPKIERIEPATLVLGGIGNVIGSGLETVDEVLLDGLPCRISEAAEAVLAFEVPFAAELLGSAVLTVRSPSGSAADDVVVVAPPPEIDALTPNPVAAGSLVTIRGRIAALSTVVTIAAVEVPLVASVPLEDGTQALSVWVPTTLAPKPYDVVVITAQTPSSPAGPLVVTPASIVAPEVTGVYPARVAKDGSVWVAGVNMERIARVVGADGGVVCDQRACRVSVAGLAPGPHVLALEGPDGAAPFDVEVVDEAPVAPAITAVEPSPATRGALLTIRGTQLAGVRSVVLGGVAQSIGFVDVDRIEITVDEATPLGAEPMFVAGNTGSETFVVTVLDPLPAEAGPEAAEPGAEIVEEDGGESGAEAEAAPKSDDGCAGGGLGAAWMLAFARLVRRARRFGVR